MYGCGFREFVECRETVHRNTTNKKLFCTVGMAIIFSRRSASTACAIGRGEGAIGNEAIASGQVRSGEVRAYIVVAIGVEGKGRPDSHLGHVFSCRGQHARASGVRKHSGCSRYMHGVDACTAGQARWHALQYTTRLFLREYSGAYRRRFMGGENTLKRHPRGSTE